MDIQFEKSELMKKLAETNDISIIEAIKSIFKAEKKDFWDELSPEQKEEIEEGERQIERGEFVDFEEFIQKYIE
jgi:predicted transcriptional regulator